MPKPGGKLHRVTIGLVIGTRPEAIKLAPVAAALEQAGALPFLYLTGQHPGLDPAVPAASGAVLPLGCRSGGNPCDYVEEVAAELNAIGGPLRPKW